MKKLTIKQAMKLPFNKFIKHIDDFWGSMDKYFEDDKHGTKRRDTKQTK